ncbi:hypothetical protein BGW41_007422 [Actinomortierella wolfii]|nr:hypothetical protein BGW41_007422 [Actinomortierella wolfii]
MNSMAVESDTFFTQATTTTSSSSGSSTSVEAVSDSPSAMEIDTVERSKRLLTLKDSMPDAQSSFTWGPSSTHSHVPPHHHHLHLHDMSSYITTPSIFATPFTSEPAGDYFGNATAADATGNGISAKPCGAADFFAAHTPAAASAVHPTATTSTSTCATTAALPPSVLQRFQAAAHHSPGVVLPSMTPAAVNIESFAASSPSYFPSTDPDPLQATPGSSSAAAAAAASSTTIATTATASSSSSTAAAAPAATLPSSFHHPPTPFMMPPAPNTRHSAGGVSDLSWVPYPPSTNTNPLPIRRSTTHISAPLSLPATTAFQTPLASPKLSLHRHSTIDLPRATELEPVEPTLVAQWMQSPEANGVQRNVMLLDMRSSVNYATCTIRDSINISVPNMLLKRPMYSLAMVMDQLTSDRELALFADWKLYTNIVFFDASGTVPVVGSPAFCMVQKFQREGCTAKLWYLQGGYNAFAPNHPDLLQAGAADTSSTNSPAPATITSSSTAASASSPSSSTSSSAHSSAATTTTPSSKPVMSPPRQRLHLGSLPTMMTTPMAGPLGCQTPMIENPNVNPLFESVRQAMGLNTAITEEIPVRLPKGFSADVIRHHLPSWLINAIDENHGKTKLAEGFQKVEVNEQKRLALLMLPQAMRAGRTIGYSIGAGIEKGLKNRYNNIWPYDHSRVKIGECAANSDDYINASFLTPPFGKKAYIATQGPLPQTFLDFWKVAWEQDTRVVVMLTRELEMGRLKCHQYWPTKDQPLMNLDDVIHLRFVSESIPDSNSPTVLVRHLTIRHCGLKEERPIAQIQYSGWPDFGVPQTPMDVLRVVDLANHFNKEKPTRPMIVHCSAGCGRTGAFCVIDSVLNEFQHNPEGLKRFANGPSLPSSTTLYHPSSSERNVLADLRSRPTTGVNERVQGLMGGHQRHGSTGASVGQGHAQITGDAGNLQDDPGSQYKRDVIFETVSIFREQRMSMVQTLRQYVFCYEAIFWSLAIELTKDTPNQVVIPPPETLHDSPNSGTVQSTQPAGVTLSRANAPITTTNSEFSFFG